MRLAKFISRLIHGTLPQRPARSPDAYLMDLVSSQHDLPFYLYPPVSRR